MTNQQGAPEALEDPQVRKLAAIGAVSTSSGLVERRPIEYRRELENQFVRGFRAAEKRLAALVEAQQPAPSAAAAVGEAPLPLLVRDIAADLGTTPIQVCTALAQLGFGGHSVNMAVTPRMAKSLREHFAATTPQADSQPAAAGATPYPMAGDEDESDLGNWQDGATKPTMDGTYLREFDEGLGTSEFCEGKWLRDGFFPSDIQDARWRGRNAPQPSPTPQADSQPAPVLDEAFDCAQAALNHCPDRASIAHILDTLRTRVDKAVFGAARAPADSVTAPAQQGKWTWVPVEPSTAMLVAGNHGQPGDFSALKVWQDMLGALERSFDYTRPVDPPSAAAQMLTYGHECPDAEASREMVGEPVFAFRRRGLDDFCTCTEERYAELSAKPNLFETRIFYTTPPAQAADSALEDAARYRHIRDVPHSEEVRSVLSLQQNAVMDKVIDKDRAAMAAKKGDTHE